MLRSLFIRDYALIEELCVEFGPGLNIITGETGAGKSILVGALKMLLGARASTDVIRDGATKSVVEGIFDVSDDSSVKRLLAERDIDDLGELIVRREISQRASRAFVNDTPVPVSVLKVIAGQLIDLHGQHDQQSLLKTETHLQTVDQYGRHDRQLTSYRSAYDRVASVRGQLGQLRKEEAELRQLAELHGFQLGEIEAIDPVAGEEDALDGERVRLENAEKLELSSKKACSILYGDSDSVYDRLAAVRAIVEELAELDPTFDPIAGELKTAAISIDDAAKELQQYSDTIELDEKRLDEVRSRLGEFELLKRKYGGTIDAVLDYRKSISEQVDQTINLDETLAQLDVELREASSVLSSAANKLSAAREKTAASIEKEVVNELIELGMPRSQFVIRFSAREDESGWVSANDGRNVAAMAEGVDLVEFMISSNSGESVRSLVKVASGGEISRIMLALKKILAQRDSLPILVFDEIDVGISGAIAQRVGESMASIASSHQLIAITHLPQIAALADQHFVVEKFEEGDRTKTGIRPLTMEERAAQVAAMISGSEVTEAALLNAKELLTAGQG